MRVVFVCVYVPRVGKMKKKNHKMKKLIPLFFYMAVLFIHLWKKVCAIFFFSVPLYFGLV